MLTFKTLTFDHKTLETGDIYTFAFIKPSSFTFKAGQHALWVLPGLTRPHPFTISSAPEEAYLTISTHVGSNSPFKRQLMALTPGKKIFMIGPLLWFTFKPGVRDYTFLAQGIGITPFRSMLVHASDAKLAVDINLIQVDSHEPAFKQLTESLAATAQYPTSVEEFQAAVRQQRNTRTFYLSGSPKFVSATKQLLTEMGVEQKQVRTDSFWGY